MKWVTRERPKIDRIACPWLIARFIDKEPEFLYVPSAEVLDTAQRTGAVPYDVPGGMRMRAEGWWPRRVRPQGQTATALRQRLNLPSTRMVDVMMKKRMIPYLKWGSKTVRFDWLKVQAALEKFELKAVGQK